MQAGSNLFVFAAAAVSSVSFASALISLACSQGCVILCFKFMLLCHIIKLHRSQIFLLCLVSTYMPIGHVKYDESSVQSVQASL